MAIDDRLITSIRKYIDEHYVLKDADTYLQAESVTSKEEEEAGTPLPQCSEYLEIPAFMKRETPPAKESLNSRLNKVEDSFSKTLLHLIDEKKLKDAEVYKRAHVDRRVFSKIRKNADYQPSKETALAFAIALHLNLNETKKFIGKAGYAISYSSKRDIIVAYFIEQQDYDIFKINEALYAFGQRLLTA